jgi:hypothetical protein
LESLTSLGSNPAGRVVKEGVRYDPSAASQLAVALAGEHFGKYQRLDYRPSFGTVSPVPVTAVSDYQLAGCLSVRRVTQSGLKPPSFQRASHGIVPEDQTVDDSLAVGVGTEDILVVEQVEGL